MKCEKAEVWSPVPYPSRSSTWSHEVTVQEESRRSAEGLSLCEGGRQVQKDEYCDSWERVIIRPNQRIRQDASYKRPIPESDETTRSFEICEILCRKKVKG